MNPLETVLGLLQSWDRWILVSHEKPDGDTLGCGSALCALAHRLGRDVRWWGRDPLPSLYGFLPRAERYETPVSAAASRDALGPEPWLWIFLDTSTEERSLPDLPAPGRDLFVNLDHHGDNSLYGSVHWVDPGAAAVGEMVTRLLLRAPWAWGVEEALGLYVAIATDTGFFRFESTTGDTLRAAACLRDRGVDLAEVEDRLHRRFAEGTLHLWGEALRRAAFARGGQVVVSWLEEEDYQRFGCEPSETENLVNLLLALRSASIAALVTPGEPGSRVSLRTRPPLDARALASRYGGGGHPRAAGCRLSLPPREAGTLLLKELSAHESLRPASGR